MAIKKAKSIEDRELDLTKLDLKALNKILGGTIEAENSTLDSDAGPPPPPNGN